VADDWTGRHLDLDIGAVAHGGCCVARHEGRVVFVRHTLPGERVRAVVTEDRVSHLFADAVTLLVPSSDRVPAPCPHAGPGQCGGCDWQHAGGAAQRRLKAAAVREQFARIAQLDIALDEVEELPGGLLGWRSRVSYAVGPEGEVGLRRHRSHEIEPLTHCPLGVEAVSQVDPDVVAQVRDERRKPGTPGVTGIDYVSGDDGAVSVITRRPARGRHARGQRPPDQQEVVAGPPRLHHRVAGRDFEVAATGFWQVHARALPVITAALLAGLQPRPGESVVELYAGAGALSAPLAEAVGPTGRIATVEFSHAAVRDARGNLADLPWVEIHQARVNPTRFAPDAADLIVLDPPRAGAGTAVMATLLALAPRAVGYVSCNPATLARDVRGALDAGWRLASLRVFDAFPMTHHVECIAVLVPIDAGPDEASDAP
jgi:tRNA/tmRNA/rRNA uracil-C5-methylase (TrmA/RlmC/RlmD family)